MAHTMADLDDITDIEAAVMQQLSYVSPSPVKDEGSSSRDIPRKRTHKRRKGKLKSITATVPPDARVVTENFELVAKEAENRALRLALTGSRSNSKREPVLRTTPTTTPNVIKAADMNEQGPMRKPRMQESGNADENETEVDAAEIVEKYRREVGRFGSRALHKRDRKRYETAELEKLGCRKPKNEKMPIGILVKKRKYQKIRERKKKEMDIATGMLVRTGRK